VGAPAQLDQGVRLRALHFHNCSLGRFEPSLTSSAAVRDLGSSPGAARTAIELRMLHLGVLRSHQAVNGDGGAELTCCTIPVAAPVTDLELGFYSNRKHRMFTISLHYHGTYFLLPCLE
jgi:hypothetical protein